VLIPEVDPLTGEPIPWDAFSAEQAGAQNAEAAAAYETDADEEETEDDFADE